MMAMCKLVGLFLILFLLETSKGGKITSVLYDNYALVGSLPSPADAFFKFSYVALLKRTNESEKFEVKSVLHYDGVMGFGVSVALGNSQLGSNYTVIGAVGSNDKSGLVKVFDLMNNCTTNNCPEVLEFVSQPSLQCNADTLVVAGNNFVASSCAVNLIGQEASPGITICTTLGATNGSCTGYYQVGIGDLVVCPKGGQLVVTSMDAREDMLVAAYCAICSEMVGNKVTVFYLSGFAVYQVNSSGVNMLSSHTSTRSLSCPQAMAINSQWVILGYPDEGSVDFYASVTGFTNYSIRYTYSNTDLLSFGAFLDCDETVAMAAATGNPASQSAGGAAIFAISYNQTFEVDIIQSTIPCINYETTYNYTFSSNVYNGTILVVTQEKTFTSWGYDVYRTCPSGTQWDPVHSTCQNCPPGQYKKSHGLPSFDLCIPCPYGTFSAKEMFCELTPCPQEYYCPAGSPTPIRPITNYVIKSVPSPEETAPLEFEDTFYYSCYPYFILFLTAIITIGVPLCCTWPSKTHAQKKLVMAMLNLNFYYYPTGEEEGFFMGDDEDRPLITDYSTNNDDDMDEFGVDQFSAEAAAIRRRHVDQFLGSLCSYFFVCTLGLMLVFVSVFMSHGYNSSVTVTLETVDQTTLSDDKLAKYAVLQRLDNSPFFVNVSLVGYNGKCTPEEVFVIVQGCHSIDYSSGCSYTVDMYVNNKTLPAQCTVKINVAASSLDQTSLFTVGFSKQDFYAQQVRFNISTDNTNKTDYTGNSYISGAVQPANGEILRGNAVVDLMSVITYIGDCRSMSPAGYFSPSLVRVNYEICVPNTTSFKSLSLLSTSVQAVNSTLYNDLAYSGFEFTINLMKGPFYKYVQQSYSVSFGTIITITAFAALDVYWLVEASVPWLGYIIYKLQTGVLALQNKL